MTARTILLLLSLLPCYREDRPTDPAKVAQGEVLASAMSAAHLTGTEVAFLLAWRDSETHGSLRIQAGYCHKWECDGGAARGPWQLHRNAMPSERWAKMVGVENTALQLDEATRRMRSALRFCHGSWRGAFIALGTGHSCTEGLRDIDRRMELYERLLTRLRGK